MIYAEEYDSVDGAIARERQLKRWKTDKKEALVCGDRGALTSRNRKSAKSSGEFKWRDLLECAAVMPPSRRT